MQTKTNSDGNKTSQNQSNNKNIGYLSGAVLVILICILTVIFLWVYDVSFRQLDPNSNNPPPLVFFVTSVFSLLVFAAVIIQIIINGLQWHAMYKGLATSDAALEQAERSMIISQTAYVMVKKLVFEDFMLGKHPTITMILHNTGQTPAYEVRVYPHFDNKKRPFSFTKAEAVDMKDPFGQEIYPIALGPNGDDTTQPVFMPVPVTEAILKFEKVQPFHFWGLITYVDIFGRDRWTEFCYWKFVPGEIKPGESSLAMNESNNDTDKPYIKEKAN